MATDVDTRELHSFCDFKMDGSKKYEEDCTTIADGLRMLSLADKLIGHNIIGFDIPVIRKLYPHVSLTDNLEDTLILSRFLFGDIKDQDFAVRNDEVARGKTPSLPGNLLGSHGLEAWGYRLKEMKGEYTTLCKELGIDPWAVWNSHMQAYCEQDVRVTAKLYDTMVRQKGYPESTRALWIEHEFAKVIFKQQQHGFKFNEAKARALEHTVRERKTVLHDKLLDLFPPWYVNLGPRVVSAKSSRWVSSPLGSEVREKKIDTGTSQQVTLKSGKTVERKVYDIVEEHGFYETLDPGCPQDRVELRVFNPASRMHIADRLKKLYGWEPVEFTSNGEPTIDDDILTALPYPPAQALAEYFMLDKRLGMIADGKQAWLRLARNGRIHGSVNTLGAITHRCTHSFPNIAQVPSVENANGVVPYGAECRDLFEADEGHVLVGCDADGLELRCLAHFMRDGGRYAKAVDEGDKDKGTDIHTVNQRAAGFSTRSMAKKFIYMFLYGAGDEAIAADIFVSGEEAKALKKKFLKGTPGLAGLITAVKAAAKANGYVRGIDGRRVPVRHQHASLNTLLQNAGAVPMKLAPVLLYQKLTADGLVWGKDWAMVAHVHDEMQITCRPELREAIKAAAMWSIEEAGRQLNFNIPLRANAVSGHSWKDTH